MDPSQFQTFLEHQTKLFQQLMQPMQQQQPLPFPLPRPLSFEGNMEENFDFFAQSWTDYSKAIGMDRWPSGWRAISVSLLLAVIAVPVKNYNLSANELESPETALRAIKAKVVTNRNVIARAIKAKVVTNRNVIADYSAFFTARQASQESIDDYAARLKRLAQVSKLGTLESDLITYKIVTTNKWQHLRTKMRKNANITLEKALDLCRAAEIPTIATDRPQQLDIIVVQGSNFNKQHQKMDVSGKSGHMAQRCQRKSGHIPVADKNENRNMSIYSPSFDPLKHYLFKTDSTFTDLYEWISCLVSSEHETPSEFIQTLTTALMKYKTKPIDTACIDECVNLIFEKAVAEPSCSEGYINLTKKLSMSMNVRRVSNGSRFRSLTSGLLKRCQDEFESDNQPANSEPNILKAEHDEEGHKMQRRAVRVVQFIGELYNHAMLTSGIMRSCIEKLIQKDDNEEALERLCKLLTTIGFKMEKDNEQDLTEYLNKMERNREQNQMMSSKVRFMIQEVIDLRYKGWKVE